MQEGMWLHVVFICRAVINICGVLWLILKLHAEAGWRSSHGSSQVGEGNATAKPHRACNTFQFEHIGNGGKEEKYPSFCSFCLLWQNRTLIYRHCKLCRSTLFLNFHWWRNCFTAPSSFSTATITTDVNTLVNDWSSYRRTRGPKTQKEATVKGHFFR